MIVKCKHGKCSLLVFVELRPGQSYEGAWHVEGMSHKEIVLKCL